MPDAACLKKVYAAFFGGTFAPFFRASERPMAIACFRLFTVPPLPPFPDFRVPCCRLRIALSTDLPAAFPYFLPPDLLLDRFVAAMIFS
jgi:hypothetical protein